MVFRVYFVVENAEEFMKFKVTRIQEQTFFVEADSIREAHEVALYQEPDINQSRQHIRPLRKEEERMVGDSDWKYQDRTSL